MAGVRPHESGAGSEEAERAEGVRKGEEVRTPFEDSGEVSEVDGEKGAAEGEADPEEDREDRSEDASIPPAAVARSRSVTGRRSWRHHAPRAAGAQPESGPGRKDWGATPIPLGDCPRTASAVAQLSERATDQTSVLETTGEASVREPVPVAASMAWLGSALPA